MVTPRSPHREKISQHWHICDLFSTLANAKPAHPTEEEQETRSRKPASKLEEEERRGDFIDLTTPSLLSSLLFRLLPTLLFSSSSSCIYAGQKDRYLLLLLLSRSRAKKNSFSLRAVEGPFVTTPSSHPFFPPSPPQGPYLIEPL